VPAETRPEFDGAGIGKPAIGMVEGRERRAKNEALFREVNERVEELSNRLAGAGDEDSLLAGFVCECSQTACTELLQVTYKTYEAVRENPRRFLVLPGHEDLVVDRVVERHKDHLVVEKIAEASDIAEEHDPRSETTA
jgi:hypothetical protein